ncbi:formyltetrahydrofolate deformylase [Thioalkalivibrio sp. ALJ16]|uniref:formyltetrahydrofolate deformylase n=1 Tax=Thioalkalivibrio sp. ALJ16 TaxID=1158762 RepID=UPI000369AF8C|nr:formyltetrahydrofolate deformylase [Thioalkalivibrio sp. ALJ16]
MDDRPRFRLSIRCPDQHGIVSRIATAIADSEGWITEAAQHTDEEAGWFFMRWVFSLPVAAEPALRQRLETLAGELGMDWWLAAADTRARVVLMASREPHCLSDLLARWSAGELAMDIPAILSNHRDLEPLAACHGIPFEHIPVPKTGREAAFQQLQTRLRQLAPDTIVLARYMQILPPGLCAEYPERILNIHHSFLPSFVGARPYHQAFARGVKLIGATCHYVTDELDAGPIIEQDVTRIRHDEGVQDLIRKGRDVERWVLARGLRYHLEGRVLTHGNKTIVFN